MSRVLAVDPALANFGWVVADMRGDLPQLLSGGVIVTRKSDRKLNVNSADDTQRRIGEIASMLWRLTDPRHGVRLIIGEQMTLPTHKNGALGVMAGVACYTAIAKARDLPIVTVQPKQLKAALGRAQLTDLPKLTAEQRRAVTPQQAKEIKRLKEQRRGESKAFVQERVREVLRDQQRKIEDLTKTMPQAVWEHFFDAVAAALACRDSQLVMMLRSMSRESGPS